MSQLREPHRSSLCSNKCRLYSCLLPGMSERESNPLERKHLAYGSRCSRGINCKRSYNQGIRKIPTCQLRGLGNMYRWIQPHDPSQSQRIHSAVGLLPGHHSSGRWNCLDQHRLPHPCAHLGGAHRGSTRILQLLQDICTGT